MNNNLDVTDEVLMAFADGQLSSAEKTRVAARLDGDANLRARLEPFVMTRAELPALFAGHLAGPIPERLLKTVRETPLGTARPPARTSSQPGLFARAMGALSETLAPSGFGMAHAFSLAALIAAGGATGYVLTKSTGEAGHYAGAELAQVLESSPSIKSTDSVAPGTSAAILTFASNDNRFCRQYEAAGTNGARTGGVACRNGDKRWQVMFETALAAKSTHDKSYESAGGPGSIELESAIDRMGDGSRLEKDQEASLLKGGWKKTSQ